MPIDTTTQANASVVMPKETYEKLKVLAQKNRRSVSKQILYWIEEQIAADEMDTTGGKK